MAPISHIGAIIENSIGVIHNLCDISPLTGSRNETETQKPTVVKHHKITFKIDPHTASRSNDAWPLISPGFKVSSLRGRNASFKNVREADHRFVTKFSPNASSWNFLNHQRTILRFNRANN